MFIWMPSSSVSQKVGSNGGDLSHGWVLRSHMNIYKRRCRTLPHLLGISLPPSLGYKPPAADANPSSSMIHQCMTPCSSLLWWTEIKLLNVFITMSFAHPLLTNYQLPTLKEDLFRLDRRLCEVVKHWKRLPSEVVHNISLETFTISSDRALSRFISLKMSLLIARGLD